MRWVDYHAKVEGKFDIALYYLRDCLMIDDKCMGEN